MLYKKQLGNLFNSWIRKDRVRESLNSFNVSHMLSFARFVEESIRGDQSKRYDSDFPEIVKGFTSDLFGAKWESIEGPSRREELVNARSGFAFIMKSRKFTLKEIGSFLGGRDHSSVINLLDRIDSIPGLRAKVALLEILTNQETVFETTLNR